MRIGLFICAAAISTPAFAADPPASPPAHPPVTLTMTSGFESQNHRPNGGIIISRNPVYVLDARITHDSGAFGRVWATAGTRRDTEIRGSVGFGGECFDGFKCQIEAGHWENITETRADAKVVSGQIGRTYALGGGGDSAGFSAQAEYLAISRRPDTQVVRGDVHYTPRLGKVPVRLQIGLAHNVRPGWWHVPASVSGAIRVSSQVTFIPSLKALFPVSDSDVRRSGVLASFTLTFKSR